MNSKNKLEGIPLTFVTFESHLVDVSSNSWWVDTEASIHVRNLLQEFETKWTPSLSEADLIIGN